MSLTNAITCIIKPIHIVQLVYQYHPCTGTQIREGQKRGVVYHIQKASVVLQGTHDDVIKWKHFRCYWPFVWGIHRSPVNSPNKGQWRGALVFSLICALNKRLSKQSWGWWFETASRPLWRHFNGRFTVYRAWPRCNTYLFVYHIYVICLVSLDYPNITHYRLWFYCLLSLSCHVYYTFMWHGLNICTNYWNV